MFCVVNILRVPISIKVGKYHQQLLGCIIFDTLTTNNQNNNITLQQTKRIIVLVPWSFYHKEPLINFAADEKNR